MGDKFFHTNSASFDEVVETLASGKVGSGSWEGVQTASCGRGTSLYTARGSHCEDLVAKTSPCAVRVGREIQILRVSSARDSAPATR